MHWSQYTSGNEEVATWRSEVERPQLDLALDLSYRYFVTRDVFVSATGSYRLFKDKLNVSSIQALPGEVVRQDYNLHNHYHVFSGQVEIGKRTIFHRFFWEVTGGLGMTAGQFAEVNYVAEAGQFPDTYKVSQDYRKGGAPFITGSVAAGWMAGERWSVLCGARLQSPFSLTRSGAQVEHRITPGGVFLGLGLGL